MAICGGKMCFGVQNELFTGPRDPVVLRFGTTGPDPGTYITVPPITSEGPWNPGMEEVHNLRTTVLLVFHRLPVRGRPYARKKIEKVSELVYLKDKSTGNHGFHFPKLWISCRCVLV